MDPPSSFTQFDKSAKSLVTSGEVPLVFEDGGQINYVKTKSKWSFRMAANLRENEVLTVVSEDGGPKNFVKTNSLRSLMMEATVWKNEKFSLTEKNFRQINY